MTNKAVKMTGAQVKDLLTKAAGGIYVSRHFGVMTDFYKKFAVTDGGLEIAVNDMFTAKIPIQNEAEYINFAVGCDISELMIPKTQFMKSGNPVYILSTNLQSLIL